MNVYTIEILDEAELDLQEAIDYYNSKQKDLSRKFYQFFELELNSISLNPFYQIRYKNIRCKK